MKFLLQFLLFATIFAIKNFERVSANSLHGYNYTETPENETTTVLPVTSPEEGTTPHSIFSGRFLFCILGVCQSQCDQRIAVGSCKFFHVCVCVAKPQVLNSTVAPTNTSSASVRPGTRLQPTLGFPTFPIPLPVVPPIAPVPAPVVPPVAPVPVPAPVVSPVAPVPAPVVSPVAPVP